MKDIRILINFDSGNDSYKNFLKNKRFKVDTRLLTQLDTNNSADLLTEYDAVILSFKNPINYIQERLEQIQNFLSISNKLLVIFLNRYQKASPSETNHIILEELINRFKGNAGMFLIPKTSGSTFTVTEAGKNNIFYEYINKEPKSWKISFRDEGYNFVNPLAINTDGDLVAFSLTDSKINAYNVFLPWFPEGEEIFWKTIERFLIQEKQDYKDVDKWVNDYSFPKLIELDEKIREKEERINELIIEKSSLEDEKGKYERIRNVLLYHDGTLLNNVCKLVLIELGINARDGKTGREDIVFEYNGDNFLIEVKGCEKSANKKHIKQVGTHVLEYTHENEKEVKGILLINAWRKLPIEERGTRDKPIFPDEIMNLVNISKVALVTTQQLFVIYCKHLEKKFNLDEFVEELKNIVGPLAGYNDINTYKKKEEKLPE